jgi:WD40 repeat protein
MPTCRVAEKGMRTMWLARSKALAWASVLLGGNSVGVLAFAPRPKGPAQPEVPAAQAVGAAPLAVKGDRVTDTRPKGSRVLHVAEGDVTRVAFGPDGRIAAGYYGPGGGRGGGVVVFDARGERVRPAPLAVKEGQVSGVAFGPDGRIAASYEVVGGVGGVAVFDARGERLLRRPVVKGGWVSGVAFGPDGRIAAGYNDVAGGGVVVFDAP